MGSNIQVAPRFRRKIVAEKEEEKRLKKTLQGGVNPKKMSPSLLAEVFEPRLKVPV